MRHHPHYLTADTMETIRQEKTTMEISQAVESRHGQILEERDLVKNSARKTNMEAERWGLRPKTVQ